VTDRRVDDWWGLDSDRLSGRPNDGAPSYRMRHDACNPLCVGQDARLRLQLWVDAVDKVGDERRAGNNRIQVPSFLNLYCAPDSNLDSMLLTRPSKNVYRQHRP
jgi:hypothetical protein